MSRTAPQSTANTLTPSFSTVSSAAGFQAGDLIYAKDNAYGTIPDNALTSGNFSIAATVNQQQSAPVNSVYVKPTNTSSGTASGGCPSIAKLSNGNIVFAFGSRVSSYYYPYFRIITENNVEVVATTNVASTNISENAGLLIGVCAIATGGFVVYYVDNSNQIKLHYYNNNGTAITTVTDNVGVWRRVYLAPSSTGNIIAAAVDSGGPYIYSRIFSSTGTAVTTWTVGGTVNSTSYPICVAVRSDNSYVLSAATSSSAITAFLYTSAGATNGTVLVTNSSGISSNYFQRCVALADDRILFIYTYSGSTWYSYRNYMTTSNTMTGEGLFLGGNAYGPVSTLDRLSSGSLVITMPMPTGTNYSYLTYYILTSDGTSISASGTVYGCFSGAEQMYMNNCASAVETSNYVTIGGSWQSQPNAGHQHVFFQIGKTSPYALRSFNTASAVVGSVTAALNGYARSASTPNSAAFLAASTTTSTLTLSPTSGTSGFVLPQTTIDNAVSNTVQHALMANGNIAFVYSAQGSPVTVKMAVYNTVGVRQSLVTVSTSAVNVWNLRIAVLTSGKIAVAFFTATSTLSVFVYDSTGTTLLASGTSSGFGGGGNNNFSMGLAALSNGKFVVSANNPSNYPRVEVFNEDCTSFFNSIPYAGATQYGCSVAATPNGGFYLWGANTGYGTWVLWEYVFTQYNSSYYYYNNSPVGTSDSNYQNNCVCTPCGTFAGLQYYAGTLSLRRASNAYFGNVNPILNSGSYGYNQANVNVLQNGRLIVFESNQSYSRYSLISPWVYSGSLNTSFDVQTNITLSSYGSTGNGPSPCVCGLYDGIAVVSLLNSSGYPSFAIISTESVSYPYTITGGVTVSSTALVPSQSNGYYLAGVSASACVAGGTGVIQTNGSATLNSQYPAGTTSQAFDFTSPTVPVGVKGTIAGRNLTIQGS